ncbi:MAG: hypothetical protein PHH77_05735 [Victivallaceae bacterium]|nr:hypothetical protein [Victivallaceae bacterium]
MLRFLIFLLPAMADVILGALVFIATVRMVNSGASAFACTLPATVWALGHSFFAGFVSRINNLRRAPALITAGGLVMGVGNLLLIVAPAPSIQLFWALVIGLGSALFFCSFQVFMKAADRNVHAGVVRSTAIYGFAWSCGLASGPFIASFIWGYLAPVDGWLYCYWINISLALIIAVAIWPLKHYIERFHQIPEAVKVRSRPPVDYSGLPDLAWLGWLTAGIGCLTIALIRTVFPYKAKVVHISKEDLGLIMAVVSYSQGFFSLLLLKSRYWMYKAVPMMLVSLCGIIGMVLFWCGTNTWVFYVGAVIYGLYSAGFFFCLVFHSLVHPEKSGKYVSWNEVIVGFTSIVAPLAGGFLVDITQNPDSPFIVGAVLILGIIGVQIFTLRKINPESVK